MISTERLDADLIIALQACPTAVHDRVDVWLTDLRFDHEAVPIPSLVIHGTADASIPIGVSGQRTLVSVDGISSVISLRRVRPLVNGCGRNVIDQEIADRSAITPPQRSVMTVETASSITAATSRGCDSNDM